MKPKEKGDNTPLRVTNCATCPWRRGSLYENLRPGLSFSALTVSRVCHQTGKDGAINGRTGIPEHICRGARDLQLQRMFAMGAIGAPTDEAWNEARVRCGMKPQPIQDPPPLKLRKKDK